MITDKKGTEVQEGDVIEFSNSGIYYKIITKEGKLGAYENGEFIALEEVLKNFVIVTPDKERR